MSTENTSAAQSEPTVVTSESTLSSSSMHQVDPLSGTNSAIEEPISKAEIAVNTGEGVEAGTEIISPVNYATAVRKAQDDATFLPKKASNSSNEEFPEEVNSEKFKEELQHELQELRDPEATTAEAVYSKNDITETPEAAVDSEETNKNFKHKEELKQELEQGPSVPVELNKEGVIQEDVQEKSEEKPEEKPEEKVDGKSTTTVPIESKAEENTIEPPAETETSSIAKKPELETKLPDFSVGDIVLAKVKGFPAWPGMVLSDELVPAAILAAKPRNPGSNPKGKRRPATGTMSSGEGVSVKVWPVRFFNDPTHCWSVKADLKFLTADEARKYLKAPKGKKDKNLLKAYEIALNPPSVEELVHGSIFEEEEEEEEEERGNEVETDIVEDTMEIDNPDFKKQGSTKRSTKKSTMAAAKSAVESAKKPKAISKKRKSSVEATEEPTDSAAIKKKKTGASAGAKSASAASGLNNGASPVKGDDDSSSSKSGGVVSTDANTSSNSTTSVAAAVPSAKQLSRAYDEKSKEVLMIRHKLQKGFLSKAPEERDMGQLSDILTQLEYFNGLEVAIIRQTKINKVLKAIIRLPQESIPLEDQYKFKPRSLKLLGVWNGWIAEDARAASGTTTNAGATATNSDASTVTSENNNVSIDTNASLTPAPENGNDSSNGGVHE